MNEELTSEQYEQLLKESAKGAEKKAVWETHVEPFFEEKRKMLLEVFESCDSSDVEKMRIVKINLNILEGMEAHFMHYIETGKFAVQHLNGLKG